MENKNKNILESPSFKENPTQKNLSESAKFAKKHLSDYVEPKVEEKENYSESNLFVKHVLKKAEAEAKTNEIEETTELVSETAPAIETETAKEQTVEQKAPVVEAVKEQTVEQKAPVVNYENALKLVGETKSLRLVLKSEGQSSTAKKAASTTAHVFTLIITYTFLILCALLFIFPFYWMIITSFKSGDEIKGLLPGLEGQQTFWPLHFVNNYADLNKRFNFGMYVSNTLVVSIFSTLGTLLTCIFGAFAFARLKFKGRDLIFTLMLSTMMIPGEMMVVTNYITVSNLGWTDGTRFGAYTAMVVPFVISIFYIYLLRQNFKQIPNELYLAAKVDGKSDWQYLWKVLVPLAMPSLVTIFILKLMGSWNAYVWPNLVAGGNDQFKLVSNGLRDSFQTGTNFDEYGRQMAATVLVTVPLLLLFVFFRKYIMRGVSRAGIKG